MSFWRNVSNDQSVRRTEQLRLKGELTRNDITGEEKDSIKNIQITDDNVSNLRNIGKMTNLLVNNLKRIVTNTETKSFLEQKFLLPFKAHTSILNLFELNTNSETLEFNTFKLKENCILFIHINLNLYWIETKNLKTRVNFNIYVNNEIKKQFNIGIDGNFDVDISTSLYVNNKDIIKFEIDKKSDELFFFGFPSTIYFEDAEIY